MAYSMKDQVANLKKHATPFYHYDLALLDDTLDAINRAVENTCFKVHYAIKANANDEILERIRLKGLGIDCVSGNEVKKAIQSGFSPKNIAFAGVGKTNDEINYGLDQEIFTFNVESIAELHVINELARVKGKIAGIAKHYGKKNSVTASFSTFVPQPFTPFQWEKMASKDEILHKQEILRENLRGIRNLKLNWHTQEVSTVEGWLSRAGLEVSALATLNAPYPYVLIVSQTV